MRAKKSSVAGNSVWSSFHSYDDEDGDDYYDEEEKEERDDDGTNAEKSIDWQKEMKVGKWKLEERRMKTEQMRKRRRSAAAVAAAARWRKEKQ